LIKPCYLLWPDILLKLVLGDFMINLSQKSGNNGLRKISATALEEILDHHNDWLNSGRRTGMRADLSRTDLRGVNLENRNLKKADLSFSNLERASLINANLVKANLSRAKLIAADLHEAKLQEASLSSSNLERARLSWANLKKADLTYAKLKEANLIKANLKGARLAHADFENTNVRSVKYSRWGEYTGIRVAVCNGNPLFRRFAQDQDHIEQFRNSFWRTPLYFLWLLLADCGRSLLLWSTWSAMFAILFSLKFYNLGPKAFSIAHLPWTKSTMIYYSVVTFTTLGFGDIVPKTPEAAWWVMAEVILGYIMLGGLISIFATKLSRRS
jgi:uncharacterized protein YjbI with pentapeptide repeats